MSALKFEPEWRISLFVALMLPLLVSLGFWQLSRADEKAAISMEFEARRSLPPVALESVLQLSDSELAYRSVVLEGRFRPGQFFLLDNRTQQGRYGNEVLGVFEVSGSDLLAVVNRGWIAADPARQSLPSPDEVPGLVTIRGQVYVPPGEQYVLADEQFTTGWPRRIQAATPEILREALGAEAENLFPHVIRSLPGEPGALYAQWPVVNVSPAKHTGYAVQWFAMAVVLLLLYILRSSNLLALLRPQKEGGG